MAGHRCRCGLGLVRATDVRHGAVSDPRVLRRTPKCAVQAGRPAGPSRLARSRLGPRGRARPGRHLHGQQHRRCRGRGAEQRRHLRCRRYGRRVCTLRAALDEANNLAGNDAIASRSARGGPQTITLPRGPPDDHDQVVASTAHTQPGLVAAPPVAPIIELTRRRPGVRARLHAPGRQLGQHDPRPRASTAAWRRSLLRHP